VAPGGRVLVVRGVGEGPYRQGVREFALPPADAQPLVVGRREHTGGELVGSGPRAWPRLGIRAGAAGQGRVSARERSCRVQDGTHLGAALAGGGTQRAAEDRHPLPQPRQGRVELASPNMDMARECCPRKAEGAASAWVIVNLTAIKYGQVHER
jgi:hypothetical protein